MASKVARAGLVALLIFLIAVTPLSAFISRGYFEVRYPERDPLSGHQLKVALHDRTGLVRGMSLASPSGPDTESVVSDRLDSRLLIVSWGTGCGAYLTQLTFERTASGYRIREQTHDSGCPFLILYGWAVAIHLWHPIDASTVELDTTLGRQLSERDT